MRKKIKGDVIWDDISNNKKKPIAYSTKSCSDLIGVLSETYPDASIKELQQMINFDIEAIDVLQKYIDKGYGNCIASEHFKYWG